MTKLPEYVITRTMNFLKKSRTSTYTRKTYDEYEIQGNYGYGWEMVTTEETRKAAREQLKCYRENEPQYAHRIVKKRISKEA